MDNYIHTMRSVSFLNDFSDEELRHIEKCLSVRTQIYEKTDNIFVKGEQPVSMGVILQGRVQEEDNDLFGNRNIVKEFHKGEAFAIDSVCMQLRSLLTTYVAAEQSKVLLLNYGKIFGGCNKNCDIRSKMLANLLKLTATELLSLNRKIKCLSQRSTREKLIAFFSCCVQEKGSNRFSISFSRQEMADYLCLNRSAMSKELCLMRNEGLLRFNRNDFELFFDSTDIVL